MRSAIALTRIRMRQGISNCVKRCCMRCYSDQNRSAEDIAKEYRDAVGGQARAGPEVADKPGIKSADVFQKMTKTVDFSIDSIKSMLRRRDYDTMMEDQTAKTEMRIKFLGADLAACHFYLSRGQRVKLTKDEDWLGPLKEKEKLPVPGLRHPGYVVEALDLSHSNIQFEGMDNFLNLQDLKYLDLSYCEGIDDWCIGRLHRLPSLVTLNVSGCKVTDRGLLSLHNVPSLRRLILEDIPYFSVQPAALLMLEEILPDCAITGVPTSADLLRDAPGSGHIASGDKTVADAVTAGEVTAGDVTAGDGTAGDGTEGRKQ